MRRILRSTTRMRPALGLEWLEDRLTLSHGPLADAPLSFDLDENHRVAPDESPALHTPPSFGQRSYGEARWSASDFPGGPLNRPSGFGGDFSPRMVVLQPMVVQVQFVLVLVDFDFAPGGGSASAPAPSPSRSDVPPPRGRSEPAALPLSTVAETSGAGEDAGANLPASRPATAVGISALPVAVASAAPSAALAANAAPMLQPSGYGALIAQLQPSLMEPALIPPRGESLPSQPQSANVAPDVSEPTPAPSEVPEARPEPQQPDSLPTTAKSEQLALLAGMSLNIEAIDAALQVMLADVEEVGGELVTWLDELSPRSWVTMAATAALAGAAGRYAWRARRRRGGDDPCEEESSSWLFTRFQSH